MTRELLGRRQQPTPEEIVAREREQGVEADKRQEFFAKIGQSEFEKSDETSRSDSIDSDRKLLQQAFEEWQLRNSTETAYVAIDRLIVELLAFATLGGALFFAFDSRSRDR